MRTLNASNHKLALAVVLIAHSLAPSHCQAPASEGTGAATSAGSAQLLQAFCGVEPGSLPAPGSRAGFMGPLQRINTTRTSYGYYKFGNATAQRPPLVIINGLGGTINDLPPSNLQELAKDQEVVVYDNPGQGFSSELLPEPSGNLSVVGMAEDALELFDLLGLETPNIVGISMGGMIAAALAAFNSERFGKIVLAPGSGGSPNSEKPQGESDRSIQSVDDPRVLPDLFPIDTPEGIGAACKFFIEHSGAVVDLANSTTFDRQREAIREFWDEEAGVWDALPAANNSFLLIYGKLDKLIPVQNSLALVPHLQNVWLATFPKAGHLVAIQEEPTYMALLQAFLAA